MTKLKDYNAKEGTRTLKDEFNLIVDKYTATFCKKHELRFDGWIGNGIGTIGCFGDYFISFDNIRYDIDNDIPEPVFFEYYDYDLRIPEGGRRVNYQSYVKGYRPYTEEQLDKIKEAQKRVYEAESALKDAIDGWKNNSKAGF